MTTITVGSTGGGAWTVIERKTGSSVASYDFTTGITGYRTYKLIGWLRPATDNVFLYARTDDAGGASFDSGASDYKYSSFLRGTGSTADNSNAAAQISFFNNTSGLRAGSDSDQRVTFEITFEPNSGAYQSITALGGFEQADDSGAAVFMSCGLRVSTTIANALQLLFSSGNIAAGDVTLYALANS
jgi:hypothetical protein